jgi:hypothetical protein
MSKRQRLNQLGKTLQKITATLENKSYTSLGPGELLSLQSKYFDLFNKEIDQTDLELSLEPDESVEPETTSETNSDPDGIL